MRPPWTLPVATALAVPFPKKRATQKGEVGTKRCHPLSWVLELRPEVFRRSRHFSRPCLQTTGLSFVVIMHLDPERESQMVEVLQAKTEMPVTQMREPTSPQPNHVYVIPPGRRIEAVGDELTLSEFEELHGRRTPVDFFFHSLAAREGGRGGVILSGGGSDGSSGINAIKKAGGLVLVQDSEEAEYDSMLRGAIATGLADLVLPVREMVARLPALKSFTPELPADPAALSEDQEGSLSQALERVRTEVGYDFSKYKRSKRRSTRAFEACGSFRSS